MKYLNDIEDYELSKIELWELKKDTAETWNDRKDDRILCHINKRKISRCSQVVHKLYKIE